MKKIIYPFTIIFTFITMLLACKKEDLPIVATEKIKNLTTFSAESGGVILSDGGGKILEKGICWDTTQNPSIQSQKTMDCSGSATYLSKLSRLSTNKLYYARAYAANGAGTAYGDEIAFTLFINSPGPIVSDADGNTYNTVKIGNQVWMTGNLQTTKFNDNTPIPMVTSSGKWQDITTPAYCFRYDNLNYKSYGAYYNWYAVNKGKLCPTGWHGSKRFRVGNPV